MYSLNLVNARLVKLTSGTHYTVSGNTITMIAPALFVESRAFFVRLSDGTNTIDINFNPCALGVYYQAAVAIGYGLWSGATFWCGATDTGGLSSSNLEVSISDDCYVWYDLTTSEYGLSSGFVSITWAVIQSKLGASPSSPYYAKIHDIDAGINYYIKIA